jgi:hypothetical protein
MAHELSEAATSKEFRNSCVILYIRVPFPYHSHSRTFNKFNEIAFLAFGLFRAINAIPLFPGAASKYASCIFVDIQRRPTELLCKERTTRADRENIRSKDDHVTASHLTF